ncbi:class I SAM-dependent methyltransferase [Dongia sp.]|uniref:class I SAM-dependent methyltransferase n=1 Tax=Dongia sp. TaxID=1977262 RepID=UPI003750B654
MSQSYKVPNEVEAHYDSIASEYEEKLGKEGINRRHFESCHRALMAMLGDRHGRKLGLELGVGSGFFTEEMSSKFDRLIAVDISQRMLDILASRLSASGITNVVIVKGDVMHLEDIPTNSVDVAYFVGLLEHITESAAFFAELSRITKLGGCVVGSVSNAQCPYYALRRRLRSGQRFHDGLRLYSHKEIKQIAEHAGFRLSAVRFWGSVPAQFPNGVVSNIIAAAEGIAARTPLRSMLGGFAFRCDRPA